MTRYTLHVPLQRNDGTPVSPLYIGLVESDLANIAGGFTSLDGSGVWNGEDRFYREPMRLYLIDAAEDLATARLIEELAQRIAVVLDQEAVYLTKQHIDTILVTPARGEINA